MYAFVTQSAAIAVNDVPLTIVEDDVWEADDPVVKAYPMFFADHPKEVKRSAFKSETKKPAKKAR